MLGNFSFGDYFKAEAIALAWDAADPRLGNSPRTGCSSRSSRARHGVPRDDEAYEHLADARLPADHIGELGADDNFWSMGDTGPCGRCSEIYYFRGAQLPCAAEASGGRCRGMECDCDRFVEIWNNVFMEFDRRRTAR